MSESVQSVHYASLQYCADYVWTIITHDSLNVFTQVGYFFGYKQYLFSSTIFHNKQPADHPFWNPLLTMYKADLAKTIVNPELLWEKPNILHKVDLAGEMHVRRLCHIRPNFPFISLLHPTPINENWHCIPNRTRAGELTKCTLQKLPEMNKTFLKGWCLNFSRSWTGLGMHGDSTYMYH